MWCRRALVVAAALVFRAAADEEAEVQKKMEDSTKPYAAPSLEGLHWAETFDGDIWTRWTSSTKDKYSGKFEAAKRKTEALVGDMGLEAPDEAKHYGVMSSFTPIVGSAEASFAIQYEVKFQTGLQCGGSYIKLFDRDGKEAAEFDDGTPYVIMFGPDRCGATDKVHFILKHKNPKTGEWSEKHFKDAPKVPQGQLSHLYGLIIKPNNDVEIHIDGQKSASGNLLTSMEPPVNPPKEIDDPKDSKPGDWIDEAKMDDPASSKPDDWDEDAPPTIPDPAAKMPSGWNEDAQKRIFDPESKKPDDWDDDEDGEWEPPMIDNPACKVGCGKWEPAPISNPKYKGKWSPPKIDNPEYKGVWKPKQIANPEFFEDQTPALLPKIDSVGIDIWTMQGGIIFDNFAIATDPAKLKSFTDASFSIRKELEELQQPKAKSASMLARIWDAMSQNLIAVAVTAALVSITTIWCCCFPSPKKKSKKAAPSKTVTEESKDPTEEEKKEEKDDPKEEPKDSAEAKEETKAEEKEPEAEKKEGGLGDIAGEEDS